MHFINKSFGCILILALTLLDVQAQTGKVLESQNMSSNLLGADVKYSVYLPADYETSQRKYPVVYLLHGSGDDETGWIQFGQAQHTLDKAIASGEIPAMIVVMPDAGTSYYVNDHQGKVRYEDMFMQELIPYVEGRYRIRNSRAYRGVAGLSMGGYGALLYAMKHPDMFVACAAFSAAIRSDEQVLALDDSGFERRFGHIAGPGLKGNARLTPYYRQHSILDLAQTIPTAELKKVSYFIDCGDDDYLTQGNALLHIKLAQLNVPHEYRSRDGSHTWQYWRTGLPEGLKFISKSFQR